MVSRRRHTPEQRLKSMDRRSKRSMSACTSVSWRTASSCSFASPHFSKDDQSSNIGFKCPSKAGVLENDSLVVTLPAKYVFGPGNPGFVDVDGALGIKVGWERNKKGHLEIRGRRIHASAPPARAYIFDYGDTEFQPIYLVFPTRGCWEITGEVAGGRLTVVTLVEKIAEGRTGRFSCSGSWRARNRTTAT
jgi:hypothetical protein